MKTISLSFFFAVLLAMSSFGQSIQTTIPATEKVVFILESDPKYTTPERMNYLFGKVQGVVKFEYNATSQQVTVEYDPSKTQPIVIEKQVEVKPYQFRWESVTKH